jgi:hypothetical protein
LHPAGRVAPSAPGAGSALPPRSAPDRTTYLRRGCADRGDTHDVRVSHTSVEHEDRMAIAQAR